MSITPIFMTLGKKSIFSILAMSVFALLMLAAHILPARTEPLMVTSSALVYIVVVGTIFISPFANLLGISKWFE